MAGSPDGHWRRARAAKAQLMNAAFPVRSFSGSRWDDSLTVSILPWSATGDISKDIVKRALTAEPGTPTDLLDGQGRCSQFPLDPFDPQPLDFSTDRTFQFPTKTIRESSRRNIGCGCQSVDRDRFMQMFIDEPQSLADQLIVHGPEVG